MSFQFTFFTYLILEAISWVRTVGLLLSVSSNQFTVSQDSNNRTYRMLIYQYRFPLHLAMR